MTRVHGVLTDRCTVRDLVPTSPEAVDAAVVELRVAAAGFAQAAAVFGGTAGLPSWVGPAASAFDASAGSVSVVYHQLAVHLPVVAQALADYAVAVRRARDAAWWAVEGMEQAALLSRAWSGSAPVPSGFTQRRPSLVVAPATPDPGEPVRAQVRARWFFAECELFDAGGRAARVLHLEGDMVAREGRSSGPVRFTAGLGGSLLRSGEAIGGQLQVVLPWQAWDVVSGDAKGLYTAARHPVATGKAVLHWDEWRSDPAGAAGGVAGDLVALVLLKGAGDAAGAAADARAVTAAGRTAEVAAGLSVAARVLDDAALARAFVLARTGAASAALGTAVTEKVLGGVAAAREATARLWAEWRAGEEGSLSLPGGRTPEPSVLDRVLKTSGTLPLVDEYVRGPNLTPFSPLRGKYEPAATAVGRTCWRQRTI